MSQYLLHDSNRFRDGSIVKIIFIAEYSMEYAEQKGWKKNGIAQTEKMIQHEMSQKLGELNRRHLENRKLKEDDANV